MPESGIIFSYTGPVDFKKIDQLLRSLKSSKEYHSIDKTTARRMYAILVESLENIAKHSAGTASAQRKLVPSVTIRREENSFILKSVNPVLSEKSDRIARRLNQVNRLKEDELLVSYEEKINSKAKSTDNGAGLGFMLMKLKSGNRLDYRFISIDRFISQFELTITINKYIMRKLIIEQTSNSPKVVLDPERRVFEISGESRPPDVSSFYNEIINWMDDYSVHLSKTSAHDDPVVFNFDLEYFNSSSAKYILDFCKQVAGVNSKGKNVKVNWHYEEGDMDMLEVGREMSRMAKIPFEYIMKGNL
jgi:hypothetical protein